MLIQPDLHRRRPLRKRRRWLWLLTAVLLLAGSVTGYVLATRLSSELPVSASTYGEIISHSEDDVTRIAVTLRGGNSWVAVRSGDGFVLEDDPSFVVSDSRVTSLTRAAATISYDEIITEDTADYLDRLDEFGLEDPRVDATFTYSDGTTAHIRVGDTAFLDDDTWSYMLLDGDDRLLALDKGTVEDLMVERELLHTVVQPTIHKARIDAVTFTGSDGMVQAAWVLDGSITDDDSGSRWRLTAPCPYPADAESMDNLRDNLVNVRLGAYMGEATDANLERYGFLSPRFVLTIHMAAGLMNSTQEDGSVAQVEWPESTVTVTVGGAKNDNVDYVLYDGAIYLTSHYSMATFMNMDPLNTVSRYPVLIALEKLASMTCNDVEYVLTRVEQLDEDGNIVKDDDGNTVYDVTVTANGREISYDAFEAAYARLENVTVSGSLPESRALAETPHTSYVFVSESGRTHTVDLAPFDALHDAVYVDGYALFYLVRNGMTFTPELTAEEATPTDLAE